MTNRTSVSVLIPAGNEQDSIAATVRAAASLGVSEIIVADDGSTDSTAQQAQQAGAQVIRLENRAGKGAALRRALSQARGDVVLLLDADLGASAAEARLLLQPVISGKADMAIAAFPPGLKAGFGIAKGIAAWVIMLLGWRRIESPLSGQRAISRNLLNRLNLANRFGVEVALTLDAMALGARIAEVQTSMIHRPTARTFSGFAHRARQAADVLCVFIPRLLWPVGPTGKLAGRPRMMAWLAFSAIWLCACFLAGQAAFGWALLVFWSFVLLLLCIAAANRLRLVKRNYAGRSLPTSVGLIFVPAMAIGCPMLGRGVPGMDAMLFRLDIRAVVVGTVLGLVGLLDDAFGSPERGLSGHFRALARGRVTTGAIKAIVGGGTCMAVALWANHWQIWPGVVDGLLIALCANSLNLLDLKPGRALKGFAAFAILSLAFNRFALIARAPLLIAVAVYAPLDLCEQVMMGDAGSNALGGLAGLLLVDVLPLSAKGALLAALIGLHIFCERRSLSEAIERIRPLRWLDNLGRPYTQPL